MDIFSDPNSPFLTHQHPSNTGLNDLESECIKNLSIHFQLKMYVLETTLGLIIPATSVKILFKQLFVALSTWKRRVIFSNMQNICKICEKDG